VIDSREQDPLKFKAAGIVEGTVVKKLNEGDYSIEGLERNIAFERKSAVDLFGTLGKGNKRFQKELARTVDYDFFGIVIETPYSVIMDKAFEGSHYCKMRADVILKILSTLMLKYNIHVFFCNGRHEATRFIRDTLTSYYRIRTEQKTFKVGDNIELIRMIQKLKKKCKVI